MKAATIAGVIGALALGGIAIAQNANTSGSATDQSGAMNSNPAGATSPSTTDAGASATTSGANTSATGAAGERG